MAARDGDTGGLAERIANASQKGDLLARRVEPTDGAIDAQAVQAAVTRANDNLFLAVLIQIDHQRGRRRGLQGILPFLNVLAIAHPQPDQLQRGETGQQQLIMVVAVHVDQAGQMGQVGVIEFGQGLAVIAQ